VGDTYVFGAETNVFGAETNLNNPNPTTFDCSELTQWAAHQAGVTIPDGATAQFLHLKKLGLIVPVEEGKNTPGALLFTFREEPRPGMGEAPGAHVGISLGNGQTVEARNSRDDVGQFTAGNRFKCAALIPGISDGRGAVPPPAEPPMPPMPPMVANPPVDPDPDPDPVPRRHRSTSAARTTTGTA
jgi:cell wall-associated NlpC family hydrolase